jgi:hypothetical protein
MDFCELREIHDPMRDVPRATADLQAGPVSDIGFRERGAISRIEFAAPRDVMQGCSTLSTESLLQQLSTF